MIEPSARRPSLAVVLVAASIVVATALAACGSGSTTVIETSTVTASSTTDSTTTSTTTDATDTSSTSTTTGSSTTANTGTTDSGGGEVLHASQFQTPSGNIGCVFSNGGVRCDAAKHEWKAGPAPSGCPLDYGDGIQVGRNGPADFVCAGDTTLGAGPKLQYGSSSSVGGATCKSAEDGVTCNSASGPGFFISIQAYKFIGG